MRFVIPLALLVSSTALSGCVTGDGSALSLASQGGVCGVNAGQCAMANPVAVVPAVPATVVPTAPLPNIGNTTTLTTGDTTIALESGKLVSKKTDPAFSNLTIDNVAGTAKIDIDPKSPNKALWPIAKTMTEYRFGSCDSISNVAAYNACLAGAGGGTGLGGTYKEYRAYSSSTGGVAVDEELQVWNWKYSYGTQYRNVTSGGDAAQQAWSAGGSKTASAAIPTSGAATYNGQFGAIATTSNWIDPPNSTIQTLSRNNTWRVVGDSALTANFGTGQFNGTLTPHLWNAYQTMNGAIGFKDVDLTLPSTYLVTDLQSYKDMIDLNNANTAYFMYQPVVLQGTITNAATATNHISGTADLDTNGGFISNSTDNPMYANFYGPAANEVTGVFNLGAMYPEPIGGTLPITKDKRGYIEMSGVFNGQ